MPHERMSNFKDILSMIFIILDPRADQFIGYSASKALVSLPLAIDQRQVLSSLFGALRISVHERRNESRA